MTTKLLITNKLIAPCGMNCGICRAYLREKRKCHGCRGSNENKSNSAINCAIKNCDELIGNNLKFCFKCGKYPCERLMLLDKRYKTKYRMSMIENLGNIEKKGIRQFVGNENNRWVCSNCGGIICAHGGYCVSCGAQISKDNESQIKNNQKTQQS